LLSSRIKDDRVLIPENEDAAVAALKTVPFKLLDQHDAEILMGRPLQIPRGNHLVLMRGLTYSSTPEFEVYQRGATFLVATHRLGSRPRLMIRKPILVITDTVPTEVFVTCDVDE
jgi:hypothetical protein